MTFKTPCTLKLHLHASCYAHPKNKFSTKKINVTSLTLPISAGDAALPEKKLVRSRQFVNSKSAWNLHRFCDDGSSSQQFLMLVATLVINYILLAVYEAALAIRKRASTKSSMHDRESLSAAEK